MNQSLRDPLWTGQYVFVLFTNLTVFISHFMLLVAVPLYLRDLGAGNTVVGLSTGLYSLTALALRPIIGHYLDHRGRILLMRGGLLPLILGVILSNFTDSISLHLALRVLQGIGFSIVSTTSATIVSDLIPNSRFAEGIGYNGMVITFTNAIGPLIGLSVIGWRGYDALFIAVIPLTVLPLIVTMFLKESGNPDRSVPIQISWKHFFRVETRAVPASILMLFAAVSYGGVVTFLTAFGNLRGIVSMQFFFAIFPMAVLLSRLFSGRLVDRFGYPPVVIPALVVGISSLVLITLAHTVALFSLAAVLFGLGYGSLQPAFNALAVQDSPPGRRGAANAAFYIALDIGIGGGSVVLGFLSDGLGPASVFVISSLMMSVSLVLFPVLERKRLHR